MNWKKWDENTWINMSNGHVIYIDMYRAVITVLYTCPENNNEQVSKCFDTRSEAVAFIEELIK